jgi:hypothetical protein
LLRLIDLSLFIASFKVIIVSSYLADYKHSKNSNKIAFACNLHGTTTEPATASLELTASSLLLLIIAEQVHVVFVYVDTGHRSQLPILHSAAFGLNSTTLLITAVVIGK